MRKAEVLAISDKERIVANIRSDQNDSPVAFNRLLSHSAVFSKRGDKSGKSDESTLKRLE